MNVTVPLLSTHLTSRAAVTELYPDPLSISTGFGPVIVIAGAVLSRTVTIRFTVGAWLP